jgi:hypothetical protein
MPRLPTIQIDQNSGAVGLAESYSVSLTKPVFASSAKLILVRRFPSLSSSVALGELLQSIGGSGDFSNVGAIDGAMDQFAIVPQSTPIRSKGVGDVSIGFIRFYTPQAAEKARRLAQVQARIRDHLDGINSSGAFGTMSTVSVSGFDLAQGSVLVYAISNCFGTIACRPVVWQVGESMHASMVFTRTAPKARTTASTS